MATSTKYDYDNNKFGFDKGDLSHVREDHPPPWGAGPYKFIKFENGTVNFEVNDSYYLGAPQDQLMSTSCRLRKTISSTASSPAPWISPDPTFSATAVDAIKAANKNDDVNGPAITTDTVDNLGYGYLGMSANTMNVNKEPGPMPPRLS